jgi:hypothetical protein
MVNLMAGHYDGNLRGSRLGMVSYENDGNVDFAARQPVRFTCHNGHTFTMPFALDAELPDTWECRCGSQALREDASWPEKAAGKTGRTHWDMLMERKNLDDLEELLFERMQVMYERRGTDFPKAYIAAIKAQRPAVSSHPVAVAEVEEDFTQTA